MRRTGQPTPGSPDSRSGSTPRKRFFLFHRCLIPSKPHPIRLIIWPSLPWCRDFRMGCWGSLCWPFSFPEGKQLFAEADDPSSLEKDDLEPVRMPSVCEQHRESQLRLFICDHSCVAPSMSTRTAKRYSQPICSR